VGNHRWNPVTAIEYVSGKVIKDFMFYRNYPHPFNLQTTIDFSFIRSANIQSVVPIFFGKKVKTLISGYKKPLRWIIHWKVKYQEKHWVAIRNSL